MTDDGKDASYDHQDHDACGDESERGYERNDERYGVALPLFGISHSYARHENEHELREKAFEKTDDSHHDAYDNADYPEYEVYEAVIESAFNKELRAYRGSHAHSHPDDVHQRIVDALSAARRTHVSDVTDKVRQRSESAEISHTVSISSRFLQPFTAVTDFSPV